MQINHYFCKSREEWLVKRARGRASLAEGAAEKIRPDEQFYNHDLNDERDVAILRFYEATRAEMQTLYEISRS